MIFAFVHVLINVLKCAHSSDEDAAWTIDMSPKDIRPVEEGIKSTIENVSIDRLTNLLRSTCSATSNGSIDSLTELLQRLIEEDASKSVDRLTNLLQRAYLILEHEELGKVTHVELLEGSNNSSHYCKITLVTKTVRAHMAYIFVARKCDGDYVYLGTYTPEYIYGDNINFRIKFLEYYIDRSEIFDIQFYFSVSSGNKRLSSFWAYDSEKALFTENEALLSMYFRAY